MGAVEALRAALGVIRQCESRLGHQWFKRVHQEALAGLKSSNSDWIHASLLTIGELVSHCGSFLQPQFGQLCDTVLSYRDHKDKKVKHAVIATIPLLASYSKDEFVQGYLATAMSHLLSSIKVSPPRPSPAARCHSLCVMV